METLLINVPEQINASVKPGPKPDLVEIVSEVRAFRSEQ